MPAANPFYIPIDLLPKAREPGGNDVPPKANPLPDDDAAAVLAEEIITYHEDRLFGPPASCEADGDGSVVVAFTEISQPLTTEGRRWKRSAQTSRDAFDLAKHYEGGRLPPRALTAIAYALGVISEVERFRQGERTAQRAGNLQARDKEGRKVNNAWLAQRAGLDPRTIQLQRKHPEMGSRLTDVEGFYREQPPSDPRERARVFHQDVPLPGLPPDAAGRVFAGSRSETAEQRGAARLVAWHLARLGDTSVLAYALGLAPYVKPKAAGSE